MKVKQLHFKEDLKLI